MPAKPMPLIQVKRNIKRYLDTRTASALFDEFVSEIYDAKSLSADDYAELRKKLTKNSRSSVMLVHLKH